MLIDAPASLLDGPVIVGDVGSTVIDNAEEAEDVRPDRLVVVWQRLERVGREGRERKARHERRLRVVVVEPVEEERELLIEHLELAELPLLLEAVLLAREHGCC